VKLSTSGAVITVPAYFKRLQRQATRTPAKLRAFEVLRIIKRAHGGRFWPMASIAEQRRASWSFDPAALQPFERLGAWEVGHWSISRWCSPPAATPQSGRRMTFARVIVDHLAATFKSNAGHYEQAAARNKQGPAASHRRQPRRPRSNSRSATPEARSILPLHHGPTPEGPKSIFDLTLVRVAKFLYI